MEPDFESYTHLFKSSYRTLVRFIVVRVNDRALAEDLAAEAFAIAWERRAGGTSISLRWLFATARNLIGNEYQKRDRERARIQRIGLEEAADVEAWGAQIESTELRLAMVQLRPSDALVLQLTYWEGLSAAEAAEFFECSVAALWVRLTRARATLKSILDGDEKMPRRARGSRGDRRG